MSLKLMKKILETCLRSRIICSSFSIWVDRMLHRGYFAVDPFRRIRFLSSFLVAKENVWWFLSSENSLEEWY